MQKESAAVLLSKAMLYYNCCPFHSILLRWEVIRLNSIFSFLLSVAASVIANYISKWLDGSNKDSKH